jgi:hypothetical protein
MEVLEQDGAAALVPAWRKIAEVADSKQSQLVT